MQQGQLVPTSLVLDLLLQAMQNSGSDRFLIDGFPRKLEQLQEFEEKIKPCDGVLVFTVPDEVAVSRLVKRGETSGRADDNEDTIRSRMQVFRDESQPVIDACRESSQVVEVDAQGEADQVFEVVSSYIAELEAQAGLEPKGPAVQEDEQAAADEPAAEEQVEQAPAAGDDEQAPAAGDEETPAAGDEQAPAEGDEQAPAAGDEEAPAEGDEQAPAAGDEEAPAAGDEQAPAAGDDEAPAAGDEQAPAAGDEEAPAAGDEQAPAAGDDEAPAAGDEQAPAAGDEEAPAAAAGGGALDDAKIVFVLGAPGAGKGTQCAKIVEHYGWNHLSTGDLLRQEVAAGSELGEAAAELMRAGQMVPTSLILELLVGAMVGAGGGRFLVDGFPRKLDQLHEFQQRIKPCDGVLVFTVPDEVAVSRLVKRGETSGRADDNEDTIRSRMQVFRDESQPVIDELAATGRVFEVDAQGGEEEIFDVVRSFMDAMEAGQLPPAPPRQHQAAPAEDAHRASSAGGRRSTLATPEAQLTLDLSEFDDEQIKAVIKIQALGRGRQDRKKVAELRASMTGEQEQPGGSAEVPAPIAEEGEQQEEQQQQGPSAEELAAQVSALLVVCGPSGVGKGTLIGRLLKDFPDRFGFSVSHTTRGSRPGEEDGVHYHFSTHEAMQELIARGMFLEHAAVHGNMYGTSLPAVAAVSATGKVAVLDIDVQGAEQVKQSSVGHKAAFLFVAPTSLEALEARLRSRGTETEEAVARRLANAAGEMERAAQPGLFHATVINDEFEVAYVDFKRQVAALIPGSLSEEDLAGPVPRPASSSSKPTTPRGLPVPPAGSKPTTPQGARASKPGTPQLPPLDHSSSKPGTPQVLPVGSKPGTPQVLPLGSKPGTPQVLAVEQLSSKPGSPQVLQAGSKPGTPLVASAGSKPGTPQVLPIGSKPGTPLVASAGSKPATPQVWSAGSKPPTPLLAAASSKPATPQVERLPSKPSTPQVERIASKPASPQVLAVEHHASKPASPVAPLDKLPSKPSTPVARGQSKPVTPLLGAGAPPPAGNRTASPAKYESAPVARSGLPVKALPVRQYMDQTVVPILREALRSLNDQRPHDPLQFLADYLLAARARMANANGGSGHAA